MYILFYKLSFDILFIYYTVVYRAEKISSSSLFLWRNLEVKKEIYVI